MRNFLIAGAVIAGIYYFTRFRALSSLKFIPRNVSINGNGLQFQVGVQNPSSSDISINSIFGKILIDGNAIGDITATVARVIKSNSETTLPLTITPNLLGSVSLLIKNIQSGYSLPKNIQLQGSANVDNNIIPLNISFT